MVPEGATVAVDGLTLVARTGADTRAGTARLTIAVALLVGSATLVAVIVTGCDAPIVAGAVYNPLTRLPTLGLSDQVTAVLLLPVTVAPN